MSIADLKDRLGVTEVTIREDLKFLLEQITGSDAETAALEDRATELPLNSPPPEIIIPDRMFCFTGKFYFGNRRECQHAVEKLGGAWHKAPRLDTDYLVIGLLGSRDWAHSSFGRKIEKAVKYQHHGEGIAIVSEKHWAEFLP